MSDEQQAALTNGDEQQAAEVAPPRAKRRNHRKSEDAEPKSAAERFADLEEKLFGGRAARVDGKIERGHGSLFRRLSEDDQRRYLALEAEVAAEAHVAAARATLAIAEKLLAEAEARCEACKEG